MKNHTVYIISASAEEAESAIEKIVKHNEGWLAINPWRITPNGIKDNTKDDLFNRVWWLCSRATAFVITGGDRELDGVERVEDAIAEYLCLEYLDLDALKEGPDGEEAVSVG